MFHEGEVFTKIITYALNGVGLGLLVLGSAEIQTFLPAEVIAYALGVLNVVKQILTEGPASVIKK